VPENTIVTYSFVLKNGEDIVAESAVNDIANFSLLGKAVAQQVRAQFPAVTYTTIVITASAES
jgi:hypothetical protein